MTDHAPLRDMEPFARLSVSDQVFEALEALLAGLPVPTAP